MATCLGDITNTSCGAVCASRGWDIAEQGQDSEARAGEEVTRYSVDVLLAVEL